MKPISHFFKSEGSRGPGADKTVTSASGSGQNQGASLRVEAKLNPEATEAPPPLFFFFNFPSLELRLDDTLSFRYVQIRCQI